MVSTSVYAVLDLQLSQSQSEMYNRFASKRYDGGFIDLFSTA